MPDCATALAALRKTETAYNAAARALDAATKAAKDADAAKAAAETAFDDATAVEQAAEKKWKDLLDAIAKDPTLGIPGMANLCGFVSDPSTQLHATLVGPFKMPDGSRRYLWGRTDQPDVQKAWGLAAERALQNAQTFYDDEQAALKALNQARAALARATQVAADAHASLNDATHKLKMADTVYQAALDNARAACGGVAGQSPQHVNGADLTVDPLVPPDREKEAKDAIGLAAPKEIKGMKVIQHYDSPKGQPANCFAYWDPADNTVHLPNSCSKKELIKHEMGHWVYHNHVLPDDSWKQFWEKHKNDMPNGLAKTDADEAFAEVYKVLRDGEKLDPAVEKEIKRFLDAIQ